MGTLGALVSLEMIAKNPHWRDNPEMVAVARGQVRVLKNYRDIKDRVNKIREVFRGV